MNLTKCFAAGFCLTAMTASAAFLGATNDFEGSTLEGTWLGGVNSSAIVDGTTGVTDAQSPIKGVTDLKVLKLDTLGGIWTNTVDQSFATTPIWADMLVKFVPSEQLPEIGLDVKMAIAVKQDEDTKFYLNLASQQGTTNGWTKTANEISTNDWYRITVKILMDMDNSAYSMVVFVNGNKVAGGVMAEGGFKVVDTPGTEKLNSIGFQGTGFIDEVAVRDDNPIATAVLLTLSFTAGTDIASVIVGGNSKNTGDTVATGSELIITAAQWKEIAAVTGPETVTWGASAAGDSCVTVTVANATATNVYITAQTETSSTPIGGATSFSGQPSNKVATWALANGVTALSNGIYDQYLFNIDDAATVPTVLITSISVTGTTVEVTVTAGSINFTTINGTLKIKTYPTLGGAETIHTITFSGTTTATITHDIGTDKFIKATVE